MSTARESIQNCLDEQGRITVWPKKHARKEAVLLYLASKFESGRTYTEKEVNALIETWHTFGDYFLLRRSLVEYGMLNRDAYGREYRKTAKSGGLQALLYERYGLHVQELKKSSIGAGSDTWFAACREGRYVVKFPCESAINHPENEILLCKTLVERGIPASRFVTTLTGEAYAHDEEGRIFHVQDYIDGTCYGLNSAPSWLMPQMAAMLGTIHTALKDQTDLPEGIGKGFFAYMTPERALESYKASLKIALSENDPSVVEDLTYRISLAEKSKPAGFDLDRLTCCATHGDYFISQLLCTDEKISAVIDWTTACVHPAVWELVRSFVYAAHSCKNGHIECDELCSYITEYLKNAPLSVYDLECMLPLFRYQLMVCDYYGQYYASSADNREIYLHQAKFSTLLLKDLEENEEKLTKSLIKLIA